MIGRLFRRARVVSPEAGWWAAADRAAVDPTDEAIAPLRQGEPGLSLDEAENRAEMIDGLDRVLALAEAGRLPTVTTQHRVIGADTCHFLAPVSLPNAAGAPGKLFVTDRRLIVAGSGVTALAWHRLRRIDRQGRAIVADGGAAAVEVLCNSYGDALVVGHLARRLAPRLAPQADR